MNTQIQTLAQKEMTRKEFLATVGFGIASIMGMGTLVKLLTGKSSLLKHGESTSGYGASAYGK